MRVLRGFIHAQASGKLVVSLVLLCCLFLSSCQSTRSPWPQKPLVVGSDVQTPSTPLHWEGRLLIEITGQAKSNANANAPQSMPHSAVSNTPITQRINAPFELDLQDNQWGELRILGPLGTTSALIQWGPEHARLQSAELSPPQQLYANLSHLVHHWLGAQLPLENMFRWLSGQEVHMEGWEFTALSSTIKTMRGRGLDPDAPWVNLKMILNEPSP